MSERFYEQPASDQRRHAPAAARNVDPIIDVLEGWLPRTGTVLEIASGTGEHALAFAKRFTALRWQPSDPHPDALTSIAAWRAGQAEANLAAPVSLDVEQPTWPLAHADAILCLNMVHISPWSASLGLLAGASRLLERDAPLILYGPWMERGVALAPSNAAFDADLRARNPAWGLREVEAFVLAAVADFLLVERRVMPANNLMLLFRRR